MASRRPLPQAASTETEVEAGGFFNIQAVIDSAYQSTPAAEQERLSASKRHTKSPPTDLKNLGDFVG